MWRLLLLSPHFHRAAGVGLTVIGLFVAATAFAATLGRASPGYTYFHRAGADLAAHNVAVDACVHAAALMRPPYVMPAPGLVGALANQAQQGPQDRAQFSANLEHCMVAKGWEVIRLPDDQGKALADLPQSQQAAALAGWVGAEHPPGEVERRYQPIYALYGGGDFHETSPPLSLSVTAGVHDLSRLNRVLAAWPPQWRPIQNEPAAATVPEGATVIVVRMKTTAPAQASLTFVRIDDRPTTSVVMADPATWPGLDYFIVASPTKLFWRPGSVLVKTFVIAVPPGRWRLQGGGAIDFCLGSPSFDVAPGAAVFAGTFDAAHDVFTPDVTLAPVQADLTDPRLASRITPAKWRNGEPFDCAAYPGNYVYRLDLPVASPTRSDADESGR